MLKAFKAFLINRSLALTLLLPTYGASESNVHSHDCHWLAYGRGKSATIIFSYDLRHHDKPMPAIFKLVPLKSIMYLHGEPRVIWKQTEVDHMIINKNLSYVVVGKFSYKLSYVKDLRKLILKQCELKREYSNRLLNE